MKKIKPRELHTNRLDIKIPTYEEQYDLWKLLKIESININLMTTPPCFNNRKEFQKTLEDWELQKKKYYLNVDNLDKDNNMYTWTIFLKGTGKVIGQISIQPNEKYNDLNIRNVGLFIDPKLHGQGLGYEVALEVLKFMFNEVEIEKVETKVLTTNIASWKLLEKLGFIRDGMFKASYKDNNEKDIYKYTYYLTKDMFVNKME